MPRTFRVLAVVLVSGVLILRAVAQDVPKKNPPEKPAQPTAQQLEQELFSHLRAALEKQNPQRLQQAAGVLDKILNLPNAGPRQLRVGNIVAQVAEMLGDFPTALQVYAKLEEVFGQHQRFGPVVKQLHQAAKRRLGILGKPLVLEGTLVSGEKLDWKQYQGKVVLVDFWATWCGPCRRELPNVLKLYRQYHSKGFEVIGVSLDHDKQRLEQFIQEHEIPWANLFPQRKEQRGWNNPVAEQFGVNAIPHTILVGRDGKVVGLALRGKRLAQKLQELLGPPAEKDSDTPASDGN